MRGSGWRVGAVVCALVLLPGCVGGATDDRTPAEMVRDDANRQVTEAVRRLQDGDARTAEQHARLVHRDHEVEVMTVSGTTPGSGDGVVLVVRVRGRAVVNDDLGREQERIGEPVCFRLVFDQGRSGQGRSEVRCPDGAPVTIPPEPALPGDVVARLRHALSAGPGSTEAEVVSAVGRLALGPAVRVRTAAAEGVVGLALRATPRDCVLARVGAGRQVEVWRPAAVQLQPGELACTGEEAVLGYGRESPR